MTEIILQAMLFVGLLFFIMLVFAYSSSKINGKNKKPKSTSQILSKKTNIREIYIQNINRTLKNAEIEKEQKLNNQKKNSSTKLVVENYNQTLDSKNGNSRNSFEFSRGFYHNDANLRYNQRINFYTNHHRNID